MSLAAFVAPLGPRQLGGEVLVHLALAQASGLLRFGPAGREGELALHLGRPGAARGPDDAAAHEDLAAATAGVRACATCSVGRCTFVPAAGARPPPPFVLDTLGETLVAVLRQLTAVQLEQVLAARGGQHLAVGPHFGRFAAALHQLGAPLLAPPPAEVSLAGLTQRADSLLQRAWVALVVLGAARPPDWQLQLEPAPGPAPGAAAAPPTPLAADIDAALAAEAAQDHFAFLGVPPTADDAQVREAYFAHAKRWHADRLVGANLDAARREGARRLFLRAEEAKRVIGQAEGREAYRWSLQQAALGLPTDPRVVVEAEGMFRRAEGLVRRGQPLPAQALLEQAVGLNPGEAEFWAYLGFVHYSVRGKEGVAAAEACFARAAKLRDLDVTHEFRGRIAHAEGEAAAAAAHLGRALELNPKNLHAERELRLLRLRQESAAAAQPTAGPWALLQRVLKR